VEQEAPAGLERVVCNLCQEPASEPFALRQGMQVVRCVRCGLVYVNPRFDAATLEQHYNSGQSSRIQYYLDVEAADRRSFGEILDLLESLRPARGRILDVGPNVGTCLLLAAERGWKAAGIEINAEAARYCREARGLDVGTGVFDDGCRPEQSFDVVLMTDVIEHLRDPLAALVLVRKLLKPGGLVLVTTPDVGHWSGRLLQIKPFEHLYYFTSATMAASLEKAGLRVLCVRSFDRHHNLTAMVHTTTFGSFFQRLAPFVRLAHRLLGDVVVRLPLRENLLAVARRDDGAVAGVEAA
jgi:2-polyprenyl-3-methyl-5-hydroxy-6-metoxy-1,4-benzoquinol methylase